MKPEKKKRKRKKNKHQAQKHQIPNTNTKPLNPKSIICSTGDAKLDIKIYTRTKIIGKKGETDRGKRKAESGKKNQARGKR